MKEATFASTKANENYALNSVSYDDNGNIKTLSRSGATNSNFTSFGNVDNLTYTYQSNSNKLSKIQDGTITNTDLGDFRDGVNTDDDYDYWLDGSLKKDRNKGIDSIQYNYLKLPQRIKFASGRTITTEYDAEGTKLKKIDSNGETTDYEEDDIYVNGKLYQTSHDEGRIVDGVYEYNINDHLGNLRMAFRDSLGIAVPTQSIFYDPWGLSMKGMQITRNSLNFNKHQFLNRETQFETGYIDLQNRQYDPQRGQMTSIDALAELSRRFSPFVYGNNNPIRFIDSDGMQATETVGADGLTNSDWLKHGSEEENREARQANNDKDRKKTTNNSNAGRRLIGTTNDNQGWGLGFNLSLTAGTFGFDASLPYANFAVIAQISEVVVYGVNENGTIVGGKDSQGNEVVTWGASGGADLAKGALPLSGGYSQESTRQNGQISFSTTKQEGTAGYSSFTAKGSREGGSKKYGSEIDIFKVKAGFGMGIEVGIKVDVPQFLSKFANTISGGVYSTNSRSIIIPSDATRVNNSHVNIFKK